MRRPQGEEESEALLDQEQDAQSIDKSTSVKSRLDRLIADKRKLAIACSSVIVFFILVIIATVYIVKSRHVYQPGLIVAKHGAVATELKECSDIGVKILQKGGNALDSGIASALCIGTINSFSSGIGGGGFLIYRPADTSIQPKVINFRESAPAAARKNMYQGNELLAQRGGLSVSVPGEVKGYEDAHRMFGNLPWSDLFEPSIEIAKYGIDCPKELSARLELFGQSFKTDPDWSPVFSPNGHLLRPGEKLIRSQYAKTLAKIAAHGSKAFYEGEIAQSIVDHCQRNGGIMTMDDLKNYEARIEDPVISTYRGLEILTCGSPSSGPVLVEGLNILENFNMSAIGNDSLGHHYLIEAMKYLSAGRTELGDPSFLKHAALARIEELQQKNFADECAANISDSKTYDWKHYNPKYEFRADHGTTSLSVIDTEGNSVAITTTVNLIFGSGLHDPNTGIILNDVSTMLLVSQCHTANSCSRKWTTTVSQASQTHSAYVHRRTTLSLRKNAAFLLKHQH